MTRFTQFEHPKMQESMKQLLQALDENTDSVLYQLLVAQDSLDDAQPSTH